MELVAWHPYGAWNFDVSTRFRGSSCTSELYAAIQLVGHTEHCDSSFRKTKRCTLQLI